MTNKELLQNYENELISLKRSPGTVRQYVRELARFSEAIGKSFLEVTNLDIRQYVNSKNSTATKERIQVTIMVFYEWLIELGLVENHPFPKMLKLSKEKRIHRFVEYEAFQEIQNWMRENFSDRDYLMIVFKFATGLRTAELLNMQVKDINFKNNSIYIFGKGKKERTVFFRPEIGQALQAYIERNKITQGYVWADQDGNPVYERYFSRLFEAAKKEFGMEKFNPHISRHSFAVWMLNQGCDVAMLQALLGHEEIATTMLYTEVQNAALQVAVMNAAPKIKV